MGSNKRLGKEFDRKTKALAHLRSGGFCECGCGQKLMPGHTQYHHIREANDGGDNSLENCLVLTTICHAPLTKKYVQETRKAERARDKHNGIIRPKGQIRGKPRRLPRNPASDPLTKTCNRF